MNTEHGAKLEPRSLEHIPKLKHLHFNVIVTFSSDLSSKLSHLTLYASVVSQPHVQTIALHLCADFSLSASGGYWTL